MLDNLPESAKEANVRFAEYLRQKREKVSNDDERSVIDDLSGLFSNQDISNSDIETYFAQRCRNDIYIKYIDKFSSIYFAVMLDRVCATRSYRGYHR